MVWNPRNYFHFVYERLVACEEKFQNAWWCFSYSGGFCYHLAQIQAFNNGQQLVGNWTVWNVRDNTFFFPVNVGQVVASKPKMCTFVRDAAFNGRTVTLVGTRGYSCLGVCSKNLCRDHYSLELSLLPILLHSQILDLPLAPQAGDFHIAETLTGTRRPFFYRAYLFYNHWIHQERLLTTWYLG